MSNVLVIGAGMAGLTAALHLVDAGLSVTIIEARDRVGGRIFSEHVEGCDVEMGAEFIHGVPQETFALLKRFELESYELDGQNLVYDGNGGVHAQGDDSAEDESPFGLLAKMTEWSDLHPHSDVTFAAWLAEQDVARGEAAGAIAFVEGFNASDHTVIGVRGLAVQQRAEDEIEGDRAFHVEGGYARLPQSIVGVLLQRGVEIVLSAQVEQIDWSPHAVDVRVADGRLFTAETAVITLPLNVLQRRVMRFTPSADNILQQADRLRMGPVCRVSLIFKSRWWSDRGHKTMAFLFPEERNENDGSPRFEVFWTSHPNTQPMITAWTGGSAAARFAEVSEGEKTAIALAGLEIAFGLEPGGLSAELIASRTHDWHADPLAGGAYTYVPEGAVDAVAAMNQPVTDTLFFAGEHTDATGHWGTVHGAIRSGVRVAKQVADSCIASTAHCETAVARGVAKSGSSLPICVRHSETDGLYSN